jgi:hypothetical protein
MGRLKKAASGVPCLRRASFAEVATKAESGFAYYALKRLDAQARRQVAIFPCSRTK